MVHAMNADLNQFVRESLLRGVPRDTIRSTLAEAGWRPEEVAAALGAWAETEFPVPVPRRRTYLSAREAFLYLVLFVTLYTTAFNVGAMLFQFIERWLPDRAITRGYSAERFSPRALRDAAAALLIAFPVFVLLSRYVGGLIAREPDKRGSKVRKWLTYVTLFIAALVILGDLIFLVARLLSGELPPRFLARVAVVGGIAGYVFGHYLADLRRDEDDHRAAPARGPSPLARVAAGVVIVTLATGLWAAGSPVKARREEIDQKRLGELQQISQGIETYYTERRSLPGSLEAVLLLPTVTIESIQDPVSLRAYEYLPVDSTSYELCASFDQPSAEGAKAYDAVPNASRFWSHPAGRHCFRLEIPQRLREPARP